MEHRTPIQIAVDIQDALVEHYSGKQKRPAFLAHARPYINAMLHLHDWNMFYGADSARSIGLYALSNLSPWRGDVAKRLKAELKNACA